MGKSEDILIFCHFDQKTFGKYLFIQEPPFRDFDLYGKAFRNASPPALPEKPLKFKKKQLERLLEGLIKPSNKPINQSDIISLLSQMNIAQKNEACEHSISEGEGPYVKIYENARSLSKKCGQCVLRSKIKSF